MEALLTSVGSFFTQIVEWATMLINLITTNPVLLIMCVAMPIVGFVVGWLSRLIRLG